MDKRNADRLKNKKDKGKEYRRKKGRRERY